MSDDFLIPTNKTYVQALEDRVNELESELTAHEEQLNSILDSLYPIVENHPAGNKAMPIADRITILIDLLDKEIA